MARWVRTHALETHAGVFVVIGKVRTPSSPGSMGVCGDWIADRADLAHFFHPIPYCDPRSGFSCVGVRKMSAMSAMSATCRPGKGLRARTYQNDVRIPAVDVRRLALDQPVAGPVSRAVLVDLHGQAVAEYVAAVSLLPEQPAQLRLPAPIG